MLDEIEMSKYQEKLHELLKELAISEKALWQQDQDVMTSYFNRLNNIYVVGFRHQYSKLFEVVNSVFDDEDKDVSVFLENLKEFRAFIIEKRHENGELLKVFDKLKDHLSLEISRRENLIKQEDKLSNLNQGYAVIEDKTKEIETKINEFSGRLSKMQTEFVGILSIFAAVVVAFSSGSNYMLSALSAVTQSFTKGVVFTALICGLILMDTLFMLIYFIGSIIERDIGRKWYLAVFANIVVVFVLVWVCHL